MWMRRKSKVWRGNIYTCFIFGGNNNVNVLCEFLKCLHVYYYSSRIEVLARVSIIDTYLLMLNENEPIPSSSRSPSVASTDDFSFFPCFSYWSVLHSSECAEFHVDSWEDDKMVQTYVALVCIPLTSFKDFKVFLFHLSWVQLSHLSAAAGMFQCSCGENGQKYVFFFFLHWMISSSCHPHFTLGYIVFLNMRVLSLTKRKKFLCGIPNSTMGKKKKVATSTHISLCLQTCYSRPIENSSLKFF